MAACAADPITPDPTLTPGAWNDPPTPLETLCRPGYTQTVRHVSNALKAQVFMRYGYDPHTVDRQNYEVDHLVSLELDGTNAIENLWPESYNPPLGAHQKDVLENTLHHMVCDRTIPLAEAQHEIATNWVTAYQKYVLHKQS